MNTTRDLILSPLPERWRRRFYTAVQAVNVAVAVWLIVAGEFGLTGSRAEQIVLGILNAVGLGVAGVMTADPAPVQQDDA